MRAKRIQFAALLLLIAACFSACAQQTQLSYQPSRYEDTPLGTIADFPGIEVDWDIGRRSVAFTLFNHAERTFECGAGYQLETLKGGVWQTVAMVEDVTFTAELYHVQPGEATLRLSADAKDYGVSAFPAGRYRLIFNINWQDCEQEALALPFTIE